MPNVTYFVQDCPTCGRKLNVRVEYLGRKVVCQHCHGAFVAWDPEGAPPEVSDTASTVTPGSSSSLSNSSLSGTKLLDRAQELLDMAEQKIAESRIIRARLDAQETEMVRK
jgi:hypothetical protein